MIIIYVSNFMQKQFTALHLAAKYSNVGVVELLVKRGAKVDPKMTVYIIDVCYVQMCVDSLFHKTSHVQVYKDTY